MICAVAAFALACSILYHEAYSFSALSALGQYGRAIEFCNDAALVLSAVSLLLIACEMQSAGAAIGLSVGVIGCMILWMQCLQMDFMTYDFFGFLGMSQTFPQHRIPLSSGVISMLIGAGLVLQLERLRVKQRSVVLIALALPIVIIALLTAFAFVISWSKGETQRLFFFTPFRSAVASSIEFILIGLGLLSVAWERRPAEEVGARELGRSIVLYSSAAVFVVSIVGSLFAVLPFYDRLRDVFDQNVLEGMKNNALSGEEFLGMLRSDLTHIDLRIPNFSLPVRAFNNQVAANAMPVPAAAKNLSTPLESDSYVLGITQLDHNGGILRTTGDEIPKDFWPADALTDSELSVHGPVELNQRLVLIVSVPVSTRSVPGETRDLVLVNAHVLEDILHNYREQNPLGQLYLGNYTAGKLSLFSYQDSTGRLIPAVNFPPGVVSFFNKSLPKTAGLMLPNDLSREPVLTAFAPLRGSNLGMSISVPLKDLYAETVHELINLIIGALLFAALSAAGIFVLIRGLVRHTELLQAQVKKSLVEKDSLLQEVHHRVKNNLQIIMSLLRLQARSLRDQAALAVFEESQNRIESISLLHELCYGSANVVEIGAGKFIEKLSRRLISSYDLKDTYSIELQGDDVSLDLDTAVPFALLMNELLTHAIKCHLAACEGEHGQMNIYLAHDNAECSVSLFESDQKFLNALDVTGPVTFSARLIGNLLKQLRGTLEILPDDQGDGLVQKKGMMFSFLNKAKTQGGDHGTVDGTVAHSNS